MRPPILALAILALAVVLGTASASARSAPDFKVTGSTHAAAGKLRGGFTVKNDGSTTSPALTATIMLLGPKKHGRAPKLAVAHPRLPFLAPGAGKRLEIKVTVPVGLARGHWSVVACVGDCAEIGGFTSRGDSAGPSGKKATSPIAPTPAGATPIAPAPSSDPVCAPSTGPLAYPVEEPFRQVGECGVEYFGFVPDSYAPGTPMPLLIWAHGCGGEAEGDVWNVGSYTAEPGKGWLALSLGGRDGGCWDPLAETEPLVMAALADFETHFNVDRHRVFLGGYSSGGDLAYRTGFRHSSTFAGLIIENSSPFRDTESTQAESLAAATTKLRIVHLAHLQDATYPIEGCATRWRR